MINKPIISQRGLLHKNHKLVLWKAKSFNVSFVGVSSAINDRYNPSSMNVLLLVVLRIQIGQKNEKSKHYHYFKLLIKLSLHRRKISQ